MVGFAIGSCLVAFLVFYGFLRKREKSGLSILPASIPESFLESEILFFRSLNPEQKQRFREKMARFLGRVRITGAGVKVSDADRWLVAASAVIPIFHFPDWEDYHLSEVILYSGPINFDFETDSHDSYILGMVGTGTMEGKMALSRKALIEGFQNKTDKHNTALHEFIHLIDKADGSIDGLPRILLDHAYALPWLHLLEKKTQEILQGQSDIHSYGATHRSEFFAVAGEYFFERPDLLRQKHPELYSLLLQMFTGRISR